MLLLGTGGIFLPLPLSMLTTDLRPVLVHCTCKFTPFLSITNQCPLYMGSTASIRTLSSMSAQSPIVISLFDFPLS